MSMRFEITEKIAEFCAARELPQAETVDLVNEVLNAAEQVDEDADIADDVARIYARVIGYDA